jgi:hypothetical protein
LAKCGLSRFKATSIVPSCHQREFGTPPSLRSRRFVPLNGFINYILPIPNRPNSKPPRNPLSCPSILGT